MSRYERFVYFARRADDTGPIKIGCSSWPKARVKQLGFDYAAKFTILCVAKGGLPAERVLHRRFAQHRADAPQRPERNSPIPGCTEWFEPVSAIFFLIADLNAGRQSLPVVDDRDAKIAALYAGGSTLQQIADEFGLTRERVRQILSEMGIERRSPTQTAALRHQRYMAAWRAKRLAA